MQYKKIVVRIVFIACLVAGTIDILNKKPADALWWMLALYFLIPLTSLALTDSAKTYIKIGGSIALIFFLAISRFEVLHLIAVGIFVGGTLYSVLRHNTLLHRRKKVTTWALAHIHSGVFCLVCAVAGSLSIMGRSSTFDVTCEQVREIVNTHTSSVLTPLRFTADQIDFIQVWVDKFFTKSPDDLIQGQVSSQLGGLVGGGAGGLTSQLDALSAQNANNPLAQKLLERARQKLIGNTLEDKGTMDEKICNVVFAQIKDWSTKPGFKLSILVSLILFFYPLIRLLAVIYAGIASIIYMILKQTGFISVVPEEKIVETWLVGDGYQGNTILSTIALQAKAQQQTTPMRRQSTSQISAQHAVSPKTSGSSSQGNDIGDILVGLDTSGGVGGGENSSETLNHIVTPNSPQAEATNTEPPKPKQEVGPHIDFGNFGGNFGKKPERN